MRKSNYLCLSVCLYITIFFVSATVVHANGEFPQRLFKTLVSNKSDKNVIYSPISIQSCLAMAYLGAKGEAAKELRAALNLGDGDIESIAKDYGVFLGKSFMNQSKNGPTLKLANRIFVNKGLQVNSNVRNLLQNNFQSDIEQLPFSKSSESVSDINNWVENSTNGQIRNLMADGSINAETGAVLVNAIYFKGEWAFPFSKHSTSEANFAVNSRKNSQVQMMYSDERVNFAELPQLDASAIELPYKHSDISMLIILPNKVEGLSQLESKLSTLDLNRDILPKFRREKVKIFLPKFKIEFETDLKAPLRELGITKLFSNNANLSGFFDNAAPQKVSEVRHKAFLDVNEAGTEAAAATFMKSQLMSYERFVKVFRADHPFVFAIRNSDTIFYAGHVANI